jgi:hypothetical protein
MKRRKVSKEVEELQESLLFHLSNYKRLKAAHYDKAKLDGYIFSLVEKLKKLSN